MRVAMRLRPTSPYPSLALGAPSLTVSPRQPGLRHRRCSAHELDDPELLRPAQHVLRLSQRIVGDALHVLG